MHFNNLLNHYFTDKVASSLAITSSFFVVSTVSVAIKQPSILSNTGGAANLQNMHQTMAAAISTPFPRLTNLDCLSVKTTTTSRRYARETASNFVASTSSDVVAWNQV